MLVPLSWLKDYVDIKMPVEELAHRLTMAGLEVENIKYIGVPAGQGVQTNHLVWDREKVVIGHILEVKPHPDADRLVLAIVESGIGEVETVVTGAPNLYPYKSQGPLNPPLVAPYAREGAELIDGHKDDGSRLIIKPRKLRGIDNKSMVCSEKELGLSDDHEGILLLTSDAPPGTPLQDVLGDVIFDIAITPNMARCQSIVGIAREVAALTGQQVRYPSLEVVATGAPIQGQAHIEIREPELNPRFMLALIRGVTLAPSPEWMQRRLRLVGMRPINNIVDITNYVMMEFGEPLHAFDYDVLVERAEGTTPTIITRRAEPGEKLTTLDGIDRTLDSFTELVTDTAGALSIAGIMGGLESEVYDASQYVLDGQGVSLPEDEKPKHGKADIRPHSTTNVLLEAASWNFINIRQTLSAQRKRGQEISSEAADRFSRGVHPALAEVGLRRAIELMRQIAGGEIAQGILDEYPRTAPEIAVDLPMEEVDRILGIAVSCDEVTAILESLEFKVERIGADMLRVIAPDHRLDIGFTNSPAEQDIQDVIARADLLEEIARIYGYDRIPATLLKDELPPQRANMSLEREEMIRDLLVKAGFQEVVTHSMTTPMLEAKLTPPEAQSSWPQLPYVQIANPINQDQTVLRHTLLARMLAVLATNIRLTTRLALFEIGQVYWPVKDEKLPAEIGHLCLAMTGERVLPTWQDPRDAGPALMDYFDLKGVVEMLVAGLHIDNVSYEAAEHNTFFPGRTACVKVNGAEIGTMGELHPLVREAFDLPDQPVLIAELDLSALIEAVPGPHCIRPVSSYPAVYQDIAIVVDESIPAAEVETVIREAGGWLLRSVRLFDVYRGGQIGAGKKSLAYALTFQADDKTLRDKDVDRIREKIVKTLESKLGARLRA